MGDPRWLLRLAGRNALRSPRRSVLTLVALVLGVGLLVVARSFVDGVDATLVAVEVDHEGAHLRIMAGGYPEQEDHQPLDMPFPEAPSVAAELAGAFSGAQVTARTAFPAEVGDGRRTLRCRGLVIDPAAYRAIFRLGGLPEPGGEAESEPYMWVGADLAGAFGWKPGDRVFLRARTRRGALDALDGVLVAGLVASGHPMVDNYTVLLPERFGRAFLDLPEGFATEVLLRLPDPEQAHAARDRIRARWPGLATETWVDRTRDFIEVNRIRRTILNVIVGLILLIAALGVANTTLMSAFERTTEIGTLLALGLPRRRVVALLTAESGYIALAGTAIGAAVGVAVSLHYARVGVHFTELKQAETVVLVPPVLYFDLRPSTVVLGVVVGVGSAVLAALLPAVRAARMAPIDALREGG